jgi:hypothetical protein
MPKSTWSAFLLLFSCVSAYQNQPRPPTEATTALGDHRHGVFDFAHAIHSSATASRSWANRDISAFVIIA